MKLHTKTHQVMSNMESGANFGMKASAKAFRILSSLYPNPIEGCVREIACNANDAHIEARKQDVPFHIHLPTALEPWFSVQDFGVGLSPESMETVFTVCFESTKIETNDLTGALGLGSKSPFGYTDQFTVVSVFDGVKYNYQAVIGTDGMPELRKVFEENTDEGNGVMVSIPVAHKDFQTFRDITQKILFWFEVLPTVNDKSLELKSYTETVQEEDFLILDDSDRSRLFGFGGYPYRALMGNVCYKIDQNNMDGYIRDLSMNEDFDSSLIRRFLNLAPIIKFDLGELDVAPARDYVLSDPASEKNFKEKLMRINDSLINIAQKHINEQDSLNDLYKAVKEDTLLRMVYSSNVKGLTFKGKNLNDYTVVIDGENFPSARVMQKKRVKVKPCRFGMNYLDDVNNGGKREINPIAIRPFVLVIDSKKHVSYNRDCFYAESNGFFDKIVFTVSEDEADGFLKELAPTEPHVEYLSDRIAKGFVLKSSPSNSPSGHTIIFYDEDAGVSAVQRWSLPDIKEYVSDHDGDVWVHGNDFTAFSTDDMRSNLAYYLTPCKEGDTVIILNEKNAKKVIDSCDNAVDLSYMKPSEGFITLMDESIWFENHKAILREVIRDIGFTMEYVNQFAEIMGDDTPKEVNSLCDKYDYFKEEGLTLSHIERKIIHTNSFDFIKEIANVREHCLEKYNVPEDDSGKRVGEWIKQVREDYPLLKSPASITIVDKNILSDLKLYVQAKKEQRETEKKEKAA